MNLRESIKISFSEISKNPLRSLLSITGVMAGVAALLAMTALNEGVKFQMLKRLEDFGGTNIIRIEPNMRVNAMEFNPQQYQQQLRYPLTLELTEDLQRKFDAEFIPQNRVPGNRFHPPVQIPGWVHIFGVVPEFARQFNVEMLEGRFITDYDITDAKLVCVISEELGSQLFRNESPLGKRLNIGGYLLEIVGLTSYRTDILTPITTNIRRLSQSDAIDVIDVRVNNSEEIDGMAASLKSYLEKWTGHTDMFDLQVPRERLERLYEARSSLTRLMIGITIICLIVGGIGVMNIMLASVKERVHEIGIRKAVGAKNRQIFSQLLFESVFICTFGGILGIFLGIYGGESAAKSIVQNPFLGEVQAVVSPQAIAVAVLFSMLVGILFGIYPAVKAAKTNVIDALRYE